MKRQDEEMENTRTSVKEKKGISRSTLWFIGIILMLLGMLSRGIIQNRFLQVSAGSTEELLNNLELAGGMTAAAVALVLEALETCAVPIFAVLTVDGFSKTKSIKKYILRVLGTAAISEIPYNFALTGKVLDLSSRNPVWGLVLGLVMLYLFHYYEGLSAGRILIKAVIFAAAIFWTLMLNVRYGVMLLLLIAVLWAFRSRESLRIWIAAAAAVCCCVGNPLYMFAPFGFLAAYLYNEEPGMQVRIIHYLMYPLMLLLIGIAGSLIA